MDCEGRRRTDGRTDRQTDMTKLIFDFCNCIANALKIKKQIIFKMFDFYKFISNLCTFSTVATSNTSTRCSSSLCNNSVRYAYSFYTGEFPSILLHSRKIKILLSNCFIQQQLMCSLMLDQYRPKYVGV
jgi:hypothetical protein